MENKPLEIYSKAGNAQDFSCGKKLIEQGKVACLVVAGGQGTRLGFDGPKGMFPVTKISQKSLFQLLAERVLAAGKNLPLAIMTSQSNDKATRHYFQEQGRFGLSSDQLHFFVQDELPFLDEHGRNLPYTGPDGNGGALQALCKAGIADLWAAQGVEYVHFILIDNALAMPFDAEFVGFHDRQRAEVSIQAVERTDPAEKVGCIVQTPRGVEVIEYSEFSEGDRQARTAEGRLKFRLANISVFCFSLPFLKNARVETLHRAWKKIPATDRYGWKLERFIFDVLPQAAKVAVQLCDREACFAPLKNSSGPDSPETVAEALAQRGVV